MPVFRICPAWGPLNTTDNHIYDRLWKFYVNSKWKCTDQYKGSRLDGHVLLPLAGIGTVGHRCRSTRPVACPVVHLSFVSLSAWSEWWRYRWNYFKNFIIYRSENWWVMRSTTKQIAIQNGHIRKYYAFHELWIFHVRLGPGLNDGLSALTGEGFQVLV